MKIPFQIGITAAVLILVVLFQYVKGRVECFTRLADDGRSCLNEGKFHTESIDTCCSFANATGFTDTSTWVIIPEFFNIQKAVSCDTCSTTFQSIKNWCFAYRNQADTTCVHIPHYSTLPAQSERDCCLWLNASGYTDAPTWRWSNGYGRFYTSCDMCYKDRFVACYARFQEGVPHGPSCDEPQARLASTPNECCRRRNVTGYARMERTPGAAGTCHPCPVDGEWSSWSTWSPCSANCGSDSRRRRLRTCGSPAPRYGGRSCFGPAEDQEACRCPGDETTTDTSIVWPDGSGIWSRWSPYSQCSVTCGTGVAERRRTCLTQNNSRLRCLGETRELHSCRYPDCPTTTAPITTSTEGSDIWTWSSWSPCHASCGYGIRTRIKTCTSAEADTTIGTQCPTENVTEIEVCHQPSCGPFPAEERSSAPGLVTAWSVSAIACATLLIGIAILICRRRRCFQGYNPHFLGERLSGTAPPVLKGRSDHGQLPPVPATAPTSHYHSVSDHDLRYVRDPYNRPDTCLDDDGYEIPRPWGLVDEVPANGKRPPTADLRASPDPPIRSWDSVLTLNHVYEQVDFDIDHVTHTGS